MIESEQKHLKTSRTSDQLKKKIENYRQAEKDDACTIKNNLYVAYHSKAFNRSKIYV